MTILIFHWSSPLSLTFWQSGRCHNTTPSHPSPTPNISSPVVRSGPHSPARPTSPHISTSAPHSLVNSGPQPAHRPASPSILPTAQPASLRDSPTGLPSPIGHVSLESFAADNLRRGLREKFPSVRLKDFVTKIVSVKSPSLPTPSHYASHVTLILLYIIVNCDNFSVNYRILLANLISSKDHCSYKEALADEGWRAYMRDEIRAFEENDTWTL